MKVLVAGGGFQGLEAAYLARKASWDVVLVDRDSNAPAVAICDVYCNEDTEVLKSAVRGSDLVIPALEDLKTLSRLREVSAAEGVPIAYDENAHTLTSSDLR